MMEMPAWEPYMDKGKALWERPFKNGKSFVSCFANGGRNVAGNYPKFDKALGKVVTFEMAINRCLRDNGEPEFSHDDVATMGLVSLYARSLSDGMQMNVKVESSEELAAYEAGKKFFYARRGQLNFACASCHVGNAGDRVRREFLSPTTGQATHWPLFRGEATLKDLFTLQRRYAACSALVRSTPLALGSEEYNDLEYFHSYMSNGLSLKSGVWRK
jgi:L-cysteine S-thiosulfotransferase